MNEELRAVSRALRRISDNPRDIRKAAVDYDTFVRIVTTQAVIRALNQISEMPS